MRWLLAVSCLILFAAAFALGLWLGGRSKRVATGFTAACLLLVLLRTLFRFFPVLEFAVLPFDAYAVIRPWWALPFAMAILGVGVRQMSTRFSRNGVGVFAAVVFLVCVQRLYYTATLDLAALHGAVDARNQVCPQTTGFTCGAAAAATLLHHYGVSADEREMAERCWTNGLTGTDEFCVARGLRQKLAGSGRVPVIRRADWETLRARREPAMATIKLSFLVDHWVVVFGVEDDVVWVGDPLQGRYPLRQAEFLERWRRTLVVVERGD